MGLINTETTADVDGTSFKISANPMNDPKFLAEAQQAIKRVQETPLFKDAGITDIEPVWILSVSLSG